MKAPITDLKGKNVFLSGPMTGKDHNNVEAFALAHAIMRESGVHYVYNPASAWLKESFCEGEKKTLEDYMRQGIHELLRQSIASEQPYYDMLVSLPGWQGSMGATLERSVALACGITCVDLEQCMCDPAGDWREC